PVIGAMTIRALRVALLAPLVLVSLLIQPAAAAPGFHAAWVDQSPWPTLRPGSTVSYTIHFRNTGDATWNRGSPLRQVSLAVGAARGQLDVGQPRRGTDRGERPAGRERHLHLPGPRAADRRYLFIAPPAGDRRHRVDGGSRRLPHHHRAAAGGYRAATGRDD